MLSINHIKRFIENHPEIKWNPYHLTRNPNVTQELFLSFPRYGIPQRWSHFSANENLTLTFLLSHIHEKWNWAEVTRNPGIAFEDIQSHPELHWHSNSILKNPNTPLSYIEEKMGTIDDDVVRFDVSGNPNDTYAFTMKFPDRVWNYTEILSRTNEEDFNLAIDSGKIPEDDYKYYMVMNPNLSRNFLSRFLPLSTSGLVTNCDCDEKLYWESEVALPEKSDNPFHAHLLLSHPLPEDEEDYENNPYSTYERLKKNEIVEYSRLLLEDNPFQRHSVVNKNIRKWLSRVMATISIFLQRSSPKLLHLPHSLRTIMKYLV